MQIRCVLLPSIWASDRQPVPRTYDTVLGGWCEKKLIRICVPTERRFGIFPFRSIVIVPRCDGAPAVQVAANLRFYREQDILLGTGSQKCRLLIASFF